MKAALLLVWLLPGLGLARHFDFLMLRYPDQTPLFHVVAPMVDGFIGQVSFEISQANLPAGVLPVVFVDDFGRESELQYVQPLATKELGAYVAALHQLREQDSLESSSGAPRVPGRLDAHKVVLSLRQAKANNKSTAQTMRSKFLKRLRHHFRRAKVDLPDKPLSAYDEVSEVSLPFPPVPLSRFPTSQTTAQKVISVEKGRVDAVYVKVLDFEDPLEEQETEQRGAPGKLDVFITRRDNLGRLLPDRLGVFVMLSPLGNLLLELEGDESAQLFADRDPSTVFVRLMFVDEEARRASLPFAVEAANRIDPKHPNSALQDLRIELTTAIGRDAGLFEGAEEEEAPPSLLTDYSSLDSIEVLNDSALAAQTQGSEGKILLEVNGPGSIVVVRVGLQSGERRSRKLLGL